MTQTDGSSALKPVPEPQPENIITMSEIRTMFHQEFDAALQPIHTWMKRADERLDALESATKTMARKDDTLTPSEVKSEIESAANAVVTQFKDITAGFESTVKAAQRSTEMTQDIWKDHVTESQSWRKATEDRQRQTDERITRIADDNIEIRRELLQATRAVTDRLERVDSQVQDNEQRINDNRTMISDIDARGQQMTNTLAEVKTTIATMTERMIRVGGVIAAAVFAPEAFPIIERIFGG